MSNQRKGVCLLSKGSYQRKVSNQRKVVCLSKGCYQRKVSNQRKGVHEKRKRGMKKKQKENQNMSEEKGGCDNKTNTKTLQKQNKYQNKL